MERDTERHEDSRDRELQSEMLSEKRDRENGSEEGRDREVGSRSRRAEMAESHDEEREADSICEPAEDERSDERRSGRDAGSAKQRDHEVHTSRDEPLHRRKPCRIGQ